jgi:hypothetical protein
LATRILNTFESVNFRELFAKSPVSKGRTAEAVSPDRFSIVWRRVSAAKEMHMNDMGGVIGLAAVVLSLGVPMALMYTYYRVKKLRVDERMAAVARGVNVPFEEPLPPAARSRKAAILLITGAIGFIACFGVIASVVHEQETWTAAAFGLIPLSVGIGYLIDYFFVRREAHS